MAKFLYTEKQFEKLASIYDLCGLLNGCDSCMGKVHCIERWDDLLNDCKPNHLIHYQRLKRSPFEPTEHYSINRELTKRLELW